MDINILTVSRVLRVLRQVGIESIPDIVSNPESISLLAMLTEEQIIQIAKEIGCENFESNMIVISIGKFFEEVSRQTMQYVSEIEKRIEHCIEFANYARDNEEQIKAKAEENKNIYIGDYLLSNYRLLCSHGIDPLKISFYESLILFEDISCSETVKSCVELLSALESEKGTKTFVSSVNDILKYVNFYAFALDIYNDADKMYNEIKSRRGD